MTNNKYLDYASFLAYSIFIIIFFYQYLGPDRLPGDNGDGRMIIGVLENFYLAFNYENFSFFKTSYLYPFNSSIFFSETLWGLSWLFLILREVGFDIFLSYKILFFVVFILNFLSCYYCCNKLGLSFNSRMFASFLFTFSLPIIAQDAHFALYFRAFIPACITCLILYFKERNINYVLYFFIFFSFQVLCGIYTSIFLAIVSCVIIIIFIKSFKKSIFHGIKDEIRIIYKGFSYFHTIFFLIFSSVILIYLFQYYKVLSLYEFTRGYPEKALINFFSFITTDRSIFWPNRLIPKGYPVHEQQLYLGFSIFIILIIFLKNINNFKISKDLKIFSKISFFSFLCFFSFFGFSLFFFLHFLPGINGIRVPCRSILIILFPLSIFLGLGFDILFKLNKNYKLIYLFLISLLLFETGTAKKVTTSIKDEDIRTEQLRKYFTNIDKSKILVFQNDNQEDIGKFLRKEFDVTFLSSKYGIKTLNGWNSFIPMGYHPLKSCEKIKNNLVEVSNFYKKNKINYNEVKKENLVFIGFKEDCTKILN